MTFLNWLRLKIDIWRDLICPKCHSKMLDTFSGDVGGKRCSNNKCDYRIRYVLW